MARYMNANDVDIYRACIFVSRENSGESLFVSGPYSSIGSAKTAAKREIKYWQNRPVTVKANIQKLGVGEGSTVLGWIDVD